MTKTKGRRKEDKLDWGVRGFFVNGYIKVNDWAYILLPSPEEEFRKFEKLTLLRRSIIYWKLKWRSWHWKHIDKHVDSFRYDLAKRIAGDQWPVDSDWD